mmetsp:Transcript_15927/g.53686  ORF Transcript_15927/g.53686 Transcript_15927/m.53686 type:complete len:230 (-) Transcript_15927:2917-3606(-)
MGAGYRASDRCRGAFFALRSSLSHLRTSSAFNLARVTVWSSTSRVLAKAARASAWARRAALSAALARCFSEITVASSCRCSPAAKSMRASAAPKASRKATTSLSVVANFISQVASLTSAAARRADRGAAGDAFRGVADRPKSSAMSTTESNSFRKRTFSESRRSISPCKVVTLAACKARVASWSRYGGPREPKSGPSEPKSSKDRARSAARSVANLALSALAAATSSRA